MKTTLRNIAMTIGLTAILGSAALFAQSNMSTAKIPFDFQVAGTTLPAGHYAVQIAGDTRLLTFRNMASGHAIALMTHPFKSGTPGESKLTFRYDGERYTMETAWFAGVEGGYGPLQKHNRADGERGIVATVRMLNK